MSLRKFWEIVKDRETWHTVVHGVCKELDMTERLNNNKAEGKGSAKCSGGAGRPLGLGKSESGESSKRPAEALEAIARNLVSLPKTLEMGRFWRVFDMIPRRHAGFMGHLLPTSGFTLIAKLMRAVNILSPLSHLIPSTQTIWALDAITSLQKLLSRSSGTIPRQSL